MNHQYINRCFTIKQQFNLRFSSTFDDDVYIDSELLAMPTSHCPCAHIIYILTEPVQIEIGSNIQRICVVHVEDCIRASNNIQIQYIYAKGMLLSCIRYSNNLILWFLARVYGESEGTKISSEWKSQTTTTTRLLVLCFSHFPLVLAMAYIKSSVCNVIKLVIKSNTITWNQIIKVYPL